MKTKKQISQQAKYLAEMKRSRVQLAGATEELYLGNGVWIFSQAECANAHAEINRALDILREVYCRLEAEYASDKETS